MQRYFPDEFVCQETLLLTNVRFARKNAVICSLKSALNDQLSEYGPGNTSFVYRNFFILHTEAPVWMLNLGMFWSNLEVSQREFHSNFNINVVESFFSTGTTVGRIYRQSKTSGNFVTSMKRLAKSNQTLNIQSGGQVLFTK